MYRCPAEEAEALAAFHQRIAAHPFAGFIVGTAEGNGADCSVSVQVSDVGCSPLCLISFAAQCLEMASERVRAMPDARAFIDFLCAVERARAALDFSPAPDAH